ncbi:cyclic peptide export ABC transporter [Luteibacter sp. dw_328]|uniref:cyclic peptide export ABC transporter n=1 Tax=Luteibacter sp. dw_328 TaxID=2719796 RepID=UPI001BD3C6FC|nr:cyclic peptide export ABC transporter [Luteibacter sp. dw_328]
MTAVREPRLDRGQFHFLAARSPNALFVSVVVGILGGAAYATLVPLILLSLSPVAPLLGEFVEQTPRFLFGLQIAHPKFALAFALMCVFALVARAVAQLIFGNITTSAVSDMRLFFAERIRRLPIQDLESLGAAKLENALNIDISRLVDGVSMYPIILSNASTIVCALAFMAFLHVKVFVLVVCVLTFGVLSYRLPLVLGQRYFRRAREARDGVQESIGAQVRGAKELKLSAARYEQFMDDGMRKDEANIVRWLRRGNAILFLAVHYGNLIGLVAIGAISFVAAPLYGLSTELLVSIVMAMLYIIGPVGIIANTFPGLVQGTVALGKLNTLLGSMPTEAAVDDPHPPVCNSVRLERVGFTYPRTDGFSIGPISLELRRGEVTFIVGGNGSGKSTLAKIVSCHYNATSGRMLYDDLELDQTMVYRAREGICAIYLDFYLFTHLFGQSPEALEKANVYLEKLGLAGKVRIEDGMFSTTELSSGQRKRLALLVAFLEDRNIYVFDEWAADQDPEFKRVFYTELLPELRSRNKIVLVISHDDRYFDQADQLIFMEHGKVISTERRETLDMPA